MAASSLALAYMLWAAWITCCVYHGQDTSERWEWAIGTSTRTGHWHEEP